MHFWALVLSHRCSSPKLTPQTSRRQGQVSTRDHQIHRDLGGGRARPCSPTFEPMFPSPVHTMSFQYPSKDTCFF